MRGKSDLAYFGGIGIALVMAVVGSWLPWVRKRPAGYDDGDPYFTSELVPGLEMGFQGYDLFIVLLVSIVAFTTVLTRYWDYRSDVIHILVGGVLLLGFGSTLRNYWASARYAIEPGLYLLVGSGLFFVLVGGVSIVTHVRPLGVTDDVDESGVE